MDVAIAKIVSMQENTSNNLRVVTENLTLVTTSLKQLGVVEASLKSVHKRVDRIESETKNVDVTEDKIKRLEYMVYAIVSSVLIYVTQQAIGG